MAKITALLIAASVLVHIDRAALPYRSLAI